MENELEKALENKFFCPSRFAQEIESLVHENGNLNYIDAIIHFCEQNSIDLESVPKLISGDTNISSCSISSSSKSSSFSIPLIFSSGMTFVALIFSIVFQKV